MIGRGGLTTPLAFVGPFCRSVGAQSTTQSWRAEPLTPKGAKSSNHCLYKVLMVDKRVKVCSVHESGFEWAKPVTTELLLLGMSSELAANRVMIKDVSA